MGLSVAVVVAVELIETFEVPDTDVNVELAGVLICNEPGAPGVQNRANDDIALNIPRAGVVIENKGRSWHVPS
jgi:hypothetical protein